MSSDALFLPSISNVPGMTQATPRMKFKSDRYTFYKEHHQESKQANSQNKEAEKPEDPGQDSAAARG